MATEKKFASQADLEEKKVSFDKLSEQCLRLHGGG